MLRGLSTGRSRKVSAIANDAAIKRLTQRLRDGHISVSLFLRRASYRLLAPFHRAFPENPDNADEDDEDDDNM